MSFGGGATIVNREERFGGVRIQTSTYGIPIPIYYGPNRMSPNLLYLCDFKSIEHKEKQASGGKGGGEVNTVNISYTYKTGIILGLGEGPLSVTSVQKNKDGWKAYSSLGLELFSGAEAQAVWGHLQANHPSEAIGYSGTGYLASADFDLGGSPDLPLLSFIGTGTASTTLGGYITDFLSNVRYGANFPAARLSGLADVDTYLQGLGMTFSPPVTEQRQASDYIREWTEMSNVDTVWSEGKLKFIPRYDSVAVAYNLGIDDFLTEGEELPVRVVLKAPSDAFNTIQIEYLDSAHEYNVATVDADDQASVDAYGPRPAAPEKYHAIKSASVARWVAQHRMQRKLYIRKQYKFRLDWRYGRLEPTTVVTLTEPKLGLAAFPVYIVEIEEDEYGTLEILAEEFNGQVSGAKVYPTESPVGVGNNQAVDPGNSNAPFIFEPPVSLAGEPQVWLATSGGDLWGGCEVWVSLDNATYERIGIITGDARHGTLRADLPTGANPDITNLLKVQLFDGELLPATTQDANDLITLMQVDGEYLAYRDSTLVGVNQYDLGYLVRGAYGSAIAQHLAGAKFARLDDSIFKYTYPSSWVGKVVYFKLPAFNVYLSGRQDLSAVTALTYTIVGAPVESVTGLVQEGVFDQTACRIKWNVVAAATGYQVEVYTNTILRRTVNTTDNRYSYTAQDAQSDGGLSRSLTFRVKALGPTGNSANWAQLVVTNPQIAAPVNARAEAGFGSAVIAADRPADSDYKGTLIWSGNASGFVLGTPIYDGPDTSFALKVEYGTTKWFRMAHYDVFGQDSLNYSGYFSVDSLSVAGVPTTATVPTTTYLGHDVVLCLLDDSLYVWNAAATPAPTYERALPMVVANQIVTIDLKAISASIGELLLGKMVLDAFGYMRGGQTAFDAGAGFWLGYDAAAGKYRFSFANQNQDKVRFSELGAEFEGTVDVKEIAQANLILNPSFGANTADWYIYQDGTPTNPIWISGDGYTANGCVQQQGFMAKVLVLEPGATYRLSVAYRWKTAAATATLYAILYSSSVAPANGLFYTPSDPAWTSPGVTDTPIYSKVRGQLPDYWTEASVEFVVPAGQQYCCLYLSVPLGYFDDVVMHKAGGRLKAKVIQSDKFLLLDSDGTVTGLARQPDVALYGAFCKGTNTELVTVDLSRHKKGDIVLVEIELNLDDTASSGNLSLGTQTNCVASPSGNRVRNYNPNSVTRVAWYVSISGTGASLQVYINSGADATICFHDMLVKTSRIN